MDEIDTGSCSDIPEDHRRRCLRLCVRCNHGAGDDSLFNGNSGCTVAAQVPDDAGGNDSDPQDDGERTAKPATNDGFAGLRGVRMFLLLCHEWLLIDEYVADFTTPRQANELTYVI